MTTQDEQAYEEVFTEYRERVFALALRMCGDRALAEDVVAEVFAKTYVHWRKGRVDDVGAYLRRAVVNQVNSTWRRRAVERAWQEQRNGDGRGARAFEEQSADTAAFRTAFGRLSHRQKSALVLRYWGDLPEAEIAAALDCSVGAVKSHLHRGLERLRVLLGPDYVTGGLR